MAWKAFVKGIAIILASACWRASLGADPPPGLARRVAARETQDMAERAHYTYRQTVSIEELDNRGLATGEYREVRDVIFSPSGERTEEFVGKPQRGLVRLQLTDEDFRDVREVQPFLFTSDLLWAYETRFKGEENVEGVDCWVLDVRPRQVFEGQRLFEGLLWVTQADGSVVKSAGQAVPQIYSRKQENLFPHFTTVRARIDGKYWFPVRTVADDILPFRNGPLHMRMTIRYENYRRFSTHSTMQFEGVTK